MDEAEKREEFDTGLRKIRHEIKSRLVHHGFFGTVAYVDSDSVDHVPTGSTVEVAVNGRTVVRSFSRQEIEGCRLKVGGSVLVAIISMVDELSV